MKTYHFAEILLLTTLLSCGCDHSQDLGHNADGGGSGGSTGGGGTPGSQSGSDGDGPGDPGGGFGGGGAGGVVVGIGSGGSGGGGVGGSGAIGGGNKRIFVTSTLYPGNLGGLPGADFLCGAASQVAGIGGTWKAWLSDDSTNALDRINDVGPWHLTNGVTVFNSKAHLALTPLQTINRDEFGAEVPNLSLVWTGTQISGRSAGISSTCGSWTSADHSVLGMTGDTSKASSWTDGQVRNCNGTYAIYCVEQ